jgi:hypothetical protein
LVRYLRVLCNERGLIYSPECVLDFLLNKELSVNGICTYVCFFWI